MKKSLDVRDINEINNSDLVIVTENIFKILNFIYIGPFKNISLLDTEVARNNGKKLISAGIPLPYWINPSILLENGIDRSSKIFYVNSIPCGIITYKLDLQKEEKYLKMLVENDFKINNGYIELKSFFVFANQQGKGLGNEMIEKMFNFFKFNLSKGDGILVTVNKDKLQYVYRFFIKHGFKDIGSEYNKKVDQGLNKSEHVLYLSK